MTSSYFHMTKSRRSIKIGKFNWACWGGGLMLGVFGVRMTSSLWPLAIIIVGALVGLPIPDAGSPHAWALKKFRARRKHKKTEGVKIAPPLIGDNQEVSGAKLQLPRIVEAHVPERNNTARQLSLLTTDSQVYVTVVLCLEGASKDWVNADTPGKFGWDLDWINRIADALSASRETDQKFVMTHIHRPANAETGYSHNQRRVRAEVFDEDATGADANIGRNTIDSHEAAYGGGGQDYDYAFLRMPWPHRFNGSKIDLTDADRFKATPLWKTITRLLTAYNETGVNARFATRADLVELWDNIFVGNLSTRRMYQQRDKALGWEPQLDQPVSVTTGKPGLNTWMEYDGVYHVAGFVSRFNRTKLEPGFEPHTFKLDNDLFYTMSTVIDVLPKKKEKRKAREHERLLKVMYGQNPLNRGLSNPDEDAELADVLAERERLSDTPWRVAHRHHIFSVIGSEPEEALAHWDDLETQSQVLLDLKKVTDGDDVEEALLAQMALLF